MSDAIKAAFFEVCTSPVETVGHYLSLYLNSPYYGGPEEGGWWGSDSSLVASQYFPTEEQAIEARDRASNLVKEMNDEARKDYGNQCRRELDWCEARGLEQSFLSEVDGEANYWLCVESTEGSQESIGCRYYE